MQYRDFAAMGFALCIAFCLVTGCSRQKGKSKAVLPGTWQSQPIVIDGDSNDWPSPYPNYDAKALVAYATSNDKRYLYVTLESGDEMTQMKILKRGLTVSIDTGGRKDPEFNINYPLENDNDPLEFPRKDEFQNSGNTNKFVQKQMGKKILKGVTEATQLSLDGFYTCNGGFIASQTNPCGIKVIVRIDSFNELVWEAAIPFKAIYNTDTLSPAYAGKPISVCFEVKAYKYPENKSGGDNSNNGGSSMNNGMGSGGMGGRGGMGGGGGGKGGKGGKTAENPMQHLYEKTKTWKQFGVEYR